MSQEQAELSAKALERALRRVSVRLQLSGEEQSAMRLAAHALRAHEALVKALEKLLRVIDDLEERVPEDAPGVPFAGVDYNEAQAALARARRTP